MYSEGNFLFDDEGNIDMMKTLILTGEDTDYYLTDLTYKTLVSELGQKFVDEYRATVREYHVTNIKTQEERISLQKLQSELEDKNNALVAQRKQRETLLEITK